MCYAAKLAMWLCRIAVVSAYSSVQYSHFTEQFSLTIVHNYVRILQVTLVRSYLLFKILLQILMSAIITMAHVPMSA